MLKLELLPTLEWPEIDMNASAWVRDFVHYKQQFFSPDPSEKPFDGLDKILLSSWVQRHSGPGDQPFVLHYWDLRMPNIMLDDENNIVGLSFLFVPC